jgi:hypothetical protein
MTFSEIARRTHHDRETIRAYPAIAAPYIRFFTCGRWSPRPYAAAATTTLI